MSATAWFIIAVVGFSLSGIALTAAVIIFIKLNIPGVIGDLSGKTVAREIKAMRDANASSGNKSHQPSAVNAERGKLTEVAPPPSTTARMAMAKLHASKRLDKTASGSLNKSTDLLPENRGTAVLAEGGATDILPENRGTEVLPQATEVLPQATEVLPQATEVLPQATEVLPQGTEVLPQATEVLPQGTEVLQSGTTVLDNTADLTEQPQAAVSFHVVRSEIRIHTDEEI